MRGVRCGSDSRRSLPSTRGTIFADRAGVRSSPRRWRSSSRSLQALQTRLATLGEDSPLAQIGERVGDLVCHLDRICAIDDLEGVRAVEIRSVASL